MAPALFRLPGGDSIQYYGKGQRTMDDSFEPQGIDDETREAIGQRAADAARGALAGAGFNAQQESAVAQAIAQAVVEALDEWMNTYYELADVDDEEEE